MGDRQELERQLEAAAADLHALLAGLTEAQINWRPGPDRWSIGDCVSHLNVSDRAVLPALDRAIESAVAHGWKAQGSFRHGWFTRWMIRSMEPPVTRRFRTFPVFAPVDARHDAAMLLADFAATRAELRERLARADGLDWGRTRVTSPVSRWLRLPFGGYLAFLLAHDRRHLWQARQVRNDPAFPA